MFDSVRPRRAVWLLALWTLLLPACTPSPTATPTPPPTALPTLVRPTATATIQPTVVPPTPVPPEPPTAVPPPTALPPQPPPPTRLPTQPPPPTPTVVLPTQPPPPTAPSNAPVLVGAGDIATCAGQGDEATALLLDGIEGTVFTLGDNVSEQGSLDEFVNCYEPTWGRHKARTMPVPGNHDYNTEGAAGYYAYFGASAGDPNRGYYSYDRGAWHIVVLNSEIDTAPESEQVQWLRADLAQHPAKCTLAMFHRPLFSSGPHGYDGSGDKTRPLWDVLYENNADVILNGHDHDYERFAPQDPQGQRDDARGIREFVVGTGGSAPYIFYDIKPNSEGRRTGHFGVLQLTLHPDSYDWVFLPVTGVLFRDHGQGECH